MKYICLWIHIITIMFLLPSYLSFFLPSPAILSCLLFFFVISLNISNFQTYPAINSSYAISTSIFYHLIVIVDYSHFMLPIYFNSDHPSNFNLLLSLSLIHLFIHEIIWLLSNHWLLILIGNIDYQPNISLFKDCHNFMTPKQFHDIVITIFRESYNFQFIENIHITILVASSSYCHVSSLDIYLLSIPFEDWLFFYCFSLFDDFLDLCNLIIFDWLIDWLIVEEKKVGMEHINKLINKTHFYTFNFFFKAIKFISTSIFITITIVSGSNFNSKIPII